MVADDGRDKISVGLANVKIIKITRTGDLKIKVRSMKYAEELTKMVKAGTL